jgi:hypothetical protein
MHPRQQFELDYFDKRYARFSEEKRKHLLAKRAAEYAADALYRSSPYGCQNGCPEGDEGFHRFSCSKAGLSA